MSVAGKGKAPAVPEEAEGVLAELLRGCFSHAQDARPTAMEALTVLASVRGRASPEPEPEPSNA